MKAIFCSSLWPGTSVVYYSASLMSFCYTLNISTFCQISIINIDIFYHNFFLFALAYTGGSANRYVVCKTKRAHNPEHGVPSVRHGSGSIILWEKYWLAWTRKKDWRMELITGQFWRKPVRGSNRLDTGAKVSLCPPGLWIWPVRWNGLDEIIFMC